MAEEEATQKMTRNQRYHLLNRESRLQKQREQYNNDPEVIAKREKREKEKEEKEAQKKAQKEAEKEAKRQQKQLELQEKINLAAETKRVRGVKSGTADSVR
jgi:hypothetical protein